MTTVYLGLRPESFIFAMGGVYFSFSCLLVFTLLVQTATSLLCKKVFFMCVCVYVCCTEFFFFIKNSSVIGEPNYVFLCVISLRCRSSS